MANQIIQSIKTIAQSLVDNAGYDKTRGGLIVGVNQVTNTYSVKVDGITYPIVRSVDGSTYNIGDVVKVVIPCNQATQMYISSSVLSDNSLGNKIANATSLAEDAKELGLDNQAEIQEVFNVANSKNKTFRQAEAPSSGMSNGDIWIDTDDGNKMYLWNGTQWVFSGDESGKMLYGTCSTAAGTTAKVVVCSDIPSTLYAGLTITVKFSTANNVLAPTLNLTSDGSTSIGTKAIWVNNAVTSTSNCLFWNTNAVITFTYDGTQWIVADQPANYYTTCSTAASTIAKASPCATCVVRKGTTVTVTFTNPHTNSTAATMYVNGQSGTARTLYINGSNVTTTNANSWSGGQSVTFIFNGQYWYATMTPVGKVEISVDTISYPNQTATLRAILFVNGKVVTPTSYQWSYGAMATDISGATSQTINITSASANGAGLSAIYNCAVSW